MARDSGILLAVSDAMLPMKTLSIVVSSYNTAGLLRDCLRAVEGARVAIPGVETVVYVVDACSTDDTAAMVQREFPTVRLRVADRNRGYAALNNLALSEIVREAPKGVDRRRVGVMLLNSDAELPPNGLAGLLDVMARHPEDGIVGPKIVLRDGSLDLACRRSFPTPVNAFWKLTGFAARFPDSPRFAQYNLTFHDPDEEIEMDSGMGACLLVRLAAIDDAGLMDAGFFMYGEDLDWAYRIKAAGWLARYYPRVVVLHRKGSASRQRSTRATLAFYGAMLRFHRLHYAARTPRFVNLFIYLAILSRGALALLTNLVRPAARRRVASAPATGQ